MKWYDVGKRKPHGGETVLAYPSRPSSTVFWDNKKEAWYYQTPTCCYPVPPCYKVEKWAYINYPKKSFETLMCSRKWNPWWKRIWKKIRRK